MKERHSQHAVILIALLFGGSVSGKAALAWTSAPSVLAPSPLTEYISSHDRSGNGAKSESLRRLSASDAVARAGQSRLNPEPAVPAGTRIHRQEATVPPPATASTAKQPEALILGNPLEGALSLPGGALAIGLLLLGGGIRSRHPEVYRIGKAESQLSHSAIRPL